MKFLFLILSLISFEISAQPIPARGNITFPGIVRLKGCIISFGGAGSITATTLCTSTPCTEYYDNCSAYSAPVRNATGDYNITAANGTFKASSPVSCFFNVRNDSDAIVTESSMQTPGITTNSSGGFTLNVLFRRGGLGTATDSKATITCISESN